MLRHVVSDRETRPPGFRDVAEKAGVSVTTVERVLNERGSVSPATRLKVLEAAGALGLRRVLPSRDYGNLRIEAILPINPTPYWAKLNAAFTAAATFLPRGITLHRTFVPENDPSAMIKAVKASKLKRSALIVAAEINDDLAVTLTEVKHKGEILVLVSTTFPGIPAQAFSGVDNVAAGRTAASLINFGMRDQPAHVLVLQGNNTLQSHRDRIHGFKAELAKIHRAEVVLMNEARGATFDCLSRMIAEKRIPDAIYETGDSGDEIAPLLKRLKSKPIWIGHERNERHDALMREGLLDFVLDQNPERQARWALRHILDRLDVTDSKFATVKRPELRLFCAANSLDFDSE